MPYEPLHHKYRPQTFAQLVGQEAIATTLSNALEQRRIAPAYLFSGPRGTGKTSSARILAKSLNCLSAGKPTPDPCGECEVCRAIAKGSALDVIEIDAASNTGVDNIRELIERSQFSPVQCRYKVYVIDECLTGDTLVTTRQGLSRLDNPNLKGQEVLSFCEVTGNWEYKKVLRWLDQGTKQTLTIKTQTREIRCTDNHLIRTEKGWIQAKNVVAGMKILSPVNAAAVNKSTNTELIAKFGVSCGDINSKATNTVQKPTIYPQFWQQQKNSNHSVNVLAANTWKSPNSSSKKAKGSKVFNLIGSSILSNKDMAFGKKERPNFLSNSKIYRHNNWDWSTEHCLVMAASTIQTPIADFLDCAGLMAIAKQNGSNTNSHISLNSNQPANECKTKVSANGQLPPEQSVTLNSVKWRRSPNLKNHKKQSQPNGSNKSPQKVELGGTWMTALYPSMRQEHQVSNSIQKDFQNPKTNSLPSGLQTWDIPQKCSLTPEKQPSESTITSNWELLQPENGSTITNNFLSPQWTTNFEIVESVTGGNAEPVYDIEVEGNHNFVANGLLVHNCHMLSVAAFNALLKTLEEPPAHVVFVLATTDPQRVLPTIISRCQRFDYRRIPLDAMVGHLQKIAAIENINIPLESVTLIAQIANGGLRDAESLLDQLSLLTGEIVPDKVWDLVGAVPERDLLTLIQTIRSDQPEAVIHHCRNLLNRGREPLVVLQNLASFYLNLLIAKTAPQRGDLIAVTQPTWQALCEEAKGWQIELILKGQQHLKESEYQLKNTTQPRLWLEITLLGLLPAAFGTVQVIQTVQAIAPSTPTTTTRPPATPQITPQVTSAPKAEISHPFGEVPVAQNIPPVAVPTPAPSPIATPTEPPPTFAAPIAPMPSPSVVPEEIPMLRDAPNVVISNGNGHPPKVEPPITPEPEPEPTPMATSSSPMISALEREQLWQRVLAVSAPMTTTEFLKQQGHLVSFTETMALVGIKNQRLLNMAKSKQANIEAAFAKIFQHPVKVSFQVGHEAINGMNDGANTNPSFMTEQTGRAKAIAAPSPAPNPFTRSPEPVKPPPVAQPMSAPQPIQITPVPVAMEPVFATPPEEELAELSDGDRLKVATQQFAEVFAGEVIELKHLTPDEINDKPEPAITSSPEPVPPSEPTLVVQGRPPVTTSIDEDIPF